MTLRTDLCRQRGGRPGSWPPEGNPYLHAMSHWGWSTPSGFQCSSWPKGSHTGPAYSWDSGGTAPRWAELWVLLLVGVVVIRVRWGWGRIPPFIPLSPPAVLAASTHHNLPPKWDQSGLRHLLLVLEDWFQGAVNRIKGGVGPMLSICPKKTFMLKSKGSFIHPTNISWAPTLCQALFSRHWPHRQKPSL